MGKIKAAITGVQGWVPDYRLTNDELSRMVDTSDEWIMQRVGISERRILKEKGKATSDMAAAAVKGLLKKTGTPANDIDLLIVATISPDMFFPSTSNLVCHKAGLKNAWGYDLAAACSGFLFALETGRNFVETGRYHKVIVVGADKMSSITDYTDRTTCPLFGDAAAAVLLEPVGEDVGIMDSILHVDGSGYKYLYQAAGGSLNPATHETVDAKMHYIYQEGQQVFKFAVSKMADVSVEMMKKHGIQPDELAWLVPHQANMRIIEATARRMGIRREQVMINIQKYGNTTAATIPLCLWEWENQLKKGDNIILAAFGGGFTWGSIYVKWAYDPE
ncbi:MAG TPA: ketoacyl-ACP synthase III [Bacteroidetes bacterium]|nr:ketoacyl-ACP synthase III [Bacteroidota bacterium]